MATTATHAQIIQEVYNSFPKAKKDFLKDQLNDLKTFSQSMDAFYFYKTPAFIKRKEKKKVRRIAGRFHKSKVNEFFITLLNYVKENDLQDNPQVMAFVYGAISHHATDSTMHPYIVFKTGQFNPKRKETWKYNGLHHDLEMNLDRYIIEKKLRKNPYKYKFYSFLTNDISDELGDVLDHSFKKVYNINNFTKKYKRSLKDMKRLLKLLRYDPSGIKLFFYKIISVFRRGKLDLKVFSYKYRSHKEHEYFNLDNNEWNYPTNNTIKSNKGLLDLYDESIKKTKANIKKVDSFLYDNKNIKLENVFKNLSYSNGVDCSKKGRAIFFSF